MPSPIRTAEARPRSCGRRPTAAAQRIEVSRVPPSPRWADRIEYHWIVRGDCPEPHDQQIIPQPCVHVTAERVDGVPRLLVNGVTREPWVRTLWGTGWAIGATFRPASFRSVLGEDPVADELNALVRLAEVDRTITRADQLADRAGVSPARPATSVHGPSRRRSQVGRPALPAARRGSGGARGDRTDWTTMAAELGFADQAHLIRAFTAAVGTPPATYQKQA